MRAATGSTSSGAPRRVEHPSSDAGTIRYLTFELAGETYGISRRSALHRHRHSAQGRILTFFMESAG
jgi:hypothetical protein